MRLTLALTLAVMSTWLSANAQDTNVKRAPPSFHRAAAKAPSPGTVFLHPERIPTKDDQFINVERGFVFVPVNRSKPRGDVIAIEVYRFKAEGGESDLPPVFQLYGGPGFPELGEHLNGRRFFEQTVWLRPEFSRAYCRCRRAGLRSSETRSRGRPDSGPSQRHPAA